ncbi:protein activator of alkane oxidation PraB [Caulobacter sp. D4A]|uniref:protein activator of alkane oxidation PraB n=1 Tax=unclassified Caulobacter TaxID=2648921 RepID=UPI000D729E2B|nr:MULTISPECIES: protein activator of alkane oxidation PraB [unclassified Caulobacter]PXA84024.1 protein activator of alkane oxidation PraB [Caulobacter sp. D4A]PXA94252.1 protein activator of alkane oxidation PraB [Caulobacter sp. D5]
MLKTASVLAAAALGFAGLAGASSASAATIAPAGGSFTLTGTLTLSQTTTVNCAVTLTGTVNAAGTAATITGGSFAPGSWQCGWLVVPSGFPWTVTPNSTTQITVSGIAASSIAGSCSGTVSLDWNNATPGSATFKAAPNNQIGGSPSVCTLVGTLTASSSTPLSIS